MTDLLGNKRPMSGKSKDIAIILNKAILDHRLMPGAKLGERELSELFDVSRIVIRQALVRLSEQLQIQWWTFAQILRFTPYMTPEKASRKITTRAPIRCRSSSLGSAAQARKVATSRASCCRVALVPSA